MFWLCLCLITFSSCKFDLTPVGVTTGSFTATNFPVNSGSATVTITEPTKGLFNISFMSSGNPDINLVGVPIERTGGIITWFSFSNTYEYPEVYPNYNISYTQLGLEFNYTDTISTFSYKTIHFDGP